MFAGIFPTRRTMSTTNLVEPSVRGAQAQNDLVGHESTSRSQRDSAVIDLDEVRDLVE